MEQSYAESQLLPLGYEVVESKVDHQDWLRSISMRLGSKVVEFECVCPSPNITSLGCPIHHNGPGDSWPIHYARVEGIARQN